MYYYLVVTKESVTFTPGNKDKNLLYSKLPIYNDAKRTNDSIIKCFGNGGNDNECSR